MSNSAAWTTYRLGYTYALHHFADIAYVPHTLPLVAHVLHTLPHYLLMVSYLARVLQVNCCAASCATRLWFVCSTFPILAFFLPLYCMRILASASLSPFAADSSQDMALYSIFNFFAGGDVTDLPRPSSCFPKLLHTVWFFVALRAGTPCLQQAPKCLTLWTTVGVCAAWCI